MNASTMTQEIPACEKIGYWGYHLILDCQGCDQSEIASRRQSERVLETLVVEMDMKAMESLSLERICRA